MTHLFSYTRKQPIQPKEGNVELHYLEFRDSFNLNKVVRTITMENDEILVLLDDLHQRLQEVPVKNKQGKVTSVKNVMNTFQSEIFLSPEDAERFFHIIGYAQ